MKKFKFMRLFSTALALLMTLFISSQSAYAAKPSNPNPVGPTQVLSAATIDTGTIISLTFNKQMMDPAGKQALFKVRIGETLQTPLSASLGSTRDIINLKLSVAVKNGETVKVSYAPVSSKNAVKATDGVALTTFTDFPAVNNVLAPATIENIYYVSLGDSIATGTTGTSTTTSFPYQFRSYLEGTYYPAKNSGMNKVTKVQLLQHAIDGQTSTDLIDRLNSDDPNNQNNLFDEAMIADVQKANIITLSIGGNDIMKHAKIPGFDTVDWTAAQIDADNFASTSWVQLIGIIKGLNPNARLIVNTGYNPFNLQAVRGYENDVAVNSEGFSFSSKTEQLICEMNYAVTVNAAALGYEVCDVYSDFHNNYGQTTMGQINLFYPYIFGLPTPYLRDPHPNQSGQSRISNLLKGFYPVPNS